MRTIGNILWFIFGGLLGGLAWVFAGCIWCITIIGIPVGLQCFKFATLAFWPFGKEIVYGNGMFSFLVNLIWIVFFGWETALQCGIFFDVFTVFFERGCTDELNFSAGKGRF